MNECIDRLIEVKAIIRVNAKYLINILNWKLKYVNYSVFDNYKYKIIEQIQNNIKIKRQVIKILKLQLEEIDEKVSGNY